MIYSAFALEVLEGYVGPGNVLGNFMSDVLLTRKYPGRMTPLMLAIQTCCLPLVRFALDYETDIDAKDNYGRNALSHIMIGFGIMRYARRVIGTYLPFREYYDLAQLFVSRGIDTTIIDVAGRTLFHYVFAYRCPFKFVGILDPDNSCRPCLAGRTPLHFAVGHDSQNS